jgi:membrane protease YdiL (CAAX protease family)
MVHPAGPRGPHPIVGTGSRSGSRVEPGQRRERRHGMPDTGARRGIAWQRIPIERVPIRYGRAELWCGLGYAAFYCVAAFGVGWIIRTAPAPLWNATRFNHDLWYILLLKIGLLLSVPVLALRWAGYRAADFLLGWQEDPRRIRRLPIAWLAGVAVNLAHLPDIRSAAMSGAVTHVPGRIALAVVLPLLTAGLPEEIVFRGFLQTRIEAAAGRIPAIVLGAALFAAWHLPTRYLLSHGSEGQAGSWGSVLLGTGVPVFVVGLLLGLAWDRWRNLPTLVAVHWGVDTLPAVASFLGISY